MKYGVKDTFSGMTYILNFIKNVLIVSKIIKESQGRTERGHGDLITFTFVFKGRRLKKI
jgi:hypothetical protein